MLIDFSVTNFRSIKEKQTFSMVAMNKIKELPKNISEDNGNISLLKSAIIYGANGSGKSNLLKSLETFQEIAIRSDANKLGDQIAGYQPYRLDSSGITKPTEFEINFIGDDKKRYIYLIIFDQYEIILESLTYFPGKNPATLFTRKRESSTIVGGQVDKDAFVQLEKTLYTNQSLLSKVGTNKVEGLLIPYNFMRAFLWFYSKLDEKIWVNFFADIIHSEKDKSLYQNLNKIIVAADTGVKSVQFKTTPETDYKFPAGMDESIKRNIINQNKYQVKTYHTTYDENGKPTGETEFNITDESAGTNKLISVSALISNVLEFGCVLVVDELDKSLHPQLTKFLIGLFNSKDSNPRNAQLIFASHDVSLLTNKLFRRDQIFFAEKNFKGSSEYYCLGDIPGVRKELSYEKYYMKGLFGGSPKINELGVQLNFSKIEEAIT